MNFGGFGNPRLLWSLVVSDLFNRMSSTPWLSRPLYITPLLASQGSSMTLITEGTTVLVDIDQLYSSLNEQWRLRESLSLDRQTGAGYRLCGPPAKFVACGLVCSPLQGTGQESPSTRCNGSDVLRVIDGTSTIYCGTCHQGRSFEYDGRKYIRGVVSADSPELPRWVAP